MPTNLNEETPPPLVLRTLAREGGRIVCRPLVVSGPIQIGALTRAQPVPPEWLARCIPLNLDEEDESWR